MCEYVPPGKLTASGACAADRFYIPINQVRPPQERAYAFWQCFQLKRRCRVDSYILQHRFFYYMGGIVPE